MNDFEKLRSVLDNQISHDKIVDSEIYDLINYEVIDKDNVMGDDILKIKISDDELSFVFDRKTKRLMYIFNSKY